MLGFKNHKVSKYIRWVMDNINIFYSNSMLVLETILTLKNIIIAKNG